MTEEKRNRMIVAITVSVIILITFLTFVVGYQLLKISKLSKNKKDLLRDIQNFQQMTEKEQNNLDYWQSRAGLEDLAYQYGFVYGK